LFVVLLVIAPASQELEPPTKPALFKVMIDRGNALPLARQASLLGLSRSGVY
jgi:hypothetical protein